MYIIKTSSCKENFTFRNSLEEEKMVLLVLYHYLYSRRMECSKNFVLGLIENSKYVMIPSVILLWVHPTHSLPALTFCASSF